MAVETIDRDTMAYQTLKRFQPQLRWVVKSVVSSLELPQEYYQLVRNRAEAWLLTYAGLDDNPSDGYGRLTAWTEHTNGDERQIKHLVAMQLRRDLTKHYLRMVKRNGNEDEYVTSTELLIGTPNEPIDEIWEDREIDRVRGSHSEARLIRRYPVLSRNVLDGVTQADIAIEMGVDERTVRRRIAGEKRSFLADYLRHNGITTEGDETLAELQEAYTNLKKSENGR